MQFVVGVSAEGFGLNVVFHSVPYENQGAVGGTLCAAAKVGLCGGLGPTVDQSGEWTGSYSTAGLAFGVSETRPALGYNSATYNVHTQRFTKFPDPLPPSLKDAICASWWAWTC